MIWRTQAKLGEFLIVTECLYGCIVCYCISSESRAANGTTEKVNRLPSDWRRCQVQHKCLYRDCVLEVILPLERAPRHNKTANRTSRQVKPVSSWQPAHQSNQDLPQILFLLAAVVKSFQSTPHLSPKNRSTRLWHFSVESKPSATAILVQLY